MLPGLSAACVMMAGGKKDPAFKNLAALFAGGADGIMIDLTDKSTLFQDSNGAAAVVNNGDFIGLALDQHKWGGKTLAEYRAAQPELMLNGKFDANITGWSLANASNGALSWQSPGKLRTTANNGNTPGAASPGFTCVVGRWYELSLDIVTAHSSYTGFAVGTTSGGGQTYNTGNLFNAPGFYRRFFRATATTQYITLYGPGGSGNIAEFDNVSVKEIDGHHATALSTARPTWASATNDVVFDGSNDYLTTDLYFQDQGNFISAYFRRGGTGAARAICGAYNAVGTQEAGYLILSSAGTPIANIGSNQLNAGGPALPGGGPYSMLADQHAVQSDLFLDGVSVANQVSPGNMPDVARGIPILVGAFNNAGSAASYFNSGVKRVVAGQVRVQNTMTAADFHANLIAA